MSDPDAFRLGENIATTPGKVVFQSDLFQLIQYQPTTAQVYRRPLLIFPPWINKYYILDLTPEKSFVRWAADRGYTVFVVSWVNPDEKLAEKTFADYLQEGIVAACDAVELATGEREMTAIGYCIGGTLLAAGLAYMAARGDDRIKAGNVLRRAGRLFRGRGSQGLRRREAVSEPRQHDGRQGLPGTARRCSRPSTCCGANDLIWSFYVNNYLMGRDPMPFDLLALECRRDPDAAPDAHVLPARDVPAQQSRETERTRVGGHADRPCGRSRYRSTCRPHARTTLRRIRRSSNRAACFPDRCVSCSPGPDILPGVINPPAKRKYQYWINEDQPLDLEEWMAGAVEHPGSWWPDWDQWLGEQSGSQVLARVPGEGRAGGHRGRARILRQAMT